MSARLSPYLSFRDNARQAMEFYHSIFAGELTIATFAEFHASEDPSEQSKVMHAMLVAPNGLVLMASDTPNTMDYVAGTNYSVALSGDHEDDAQLRGYWDRLSEGATVTMPLAKAGWGDTFGMCTDTFGVQWLVNIAAGPA
jgi:PhnB protein